MCKRPSADSCWDDMIFEEETIILEEEEDSFGEKAIFFGEKSPFSPDNCEKIIAVRV